MGTVDCEQGMEGWYDAAVCGLVREVGGGAVSCVSLRAWDVPLAVTEGFSRGVRREARLSMDHAVAVPECRVFGTGRGVGRRRKARRRRAAGATRGGTG